MTHLGSCDFTGFEAFSYVPQNLPELLAVISDEILDPPPNCLADGLRIPSNFHPFFLWVGNYITDHVMKALQYYIKLSKKNNDPTLGDMRSGEVRGHSKIQ